MHAGYVQQRMPAQCDTGSCIGTRKLNSVAGWAKHAILYKFASLEGFNRDYAAANAKSPLGLRGHSIVSMLIHAPSGPNSALRSWSPVSKAQARRKGSEWRRLGGLQYHTDHSILVLSILAFDVGRLHTENGLGGCSYHEFAWTIGADSVTVQPAEKRRVFGKQDERPPRLVRRRAEADLRVKHRKTS